MGIIFPTFIYIIVLQLGVSRYLGNADASTDIRTMQSGWMVVISTNAPEQGLPVKQNGFLTKFRTAWDGVALYLYIINGATEVYFGTAWNFSDASYPTWKRLLPSSLG